MAHLSARPADTDLEPLPTFGHYLARFGGDDDVYLSSCLRGHLSHRYGVARLWAVPQLRTVPQQFPQPPHGTY